MNQRISVVLVLFFLSNILLGGCGGGSGDRAGGSSSAAGAASGDGSAGPGGLEDMSVPDIMDQGPSLTCDSNSDDIRPRLIDVSRALHVLPPLGKNSGDADNFDTSLLDYLAVSICRVAGEDECLPENEFTSAGGPGGMDHIRLQNSTYHVNWDISKDQTGEVFEVRFLVAGLKVGAVSYSSRSPRTLPIKSGIDNHPRIRARVLHEQGYSAAQIARWLVDEFASGGAGIAAILYEENFSAVELGEALRDVLNAEAQDAADWLKEGSVPSTFAGAVLKEAFNLDALDSATILRLAGYDAVEVYLALKCVFGLNVHDAEQVLIDAGFTEDEAFEAVAPDLFAWYGQVIEDYGPVIYLHPLELYHTSSVDWFLERSKLWYRQGAQDLEYAGEVTKDNLTSVVEELGIVGASDLWFKLNAGQAAMAGDLSSTRSYVHAVRLKDVGVTDLQFWFFYPYNGPGTTYAKLWMSLWGLPEFDWDDGNGSDDYGNSKPLGEHTGDWEAVVLRIDNDTSQLLNVFMSQHGVYPMYGPQEIELESGHVVAYPSLNGHANYPAQGSNGHVEKHKKLADIKVMELGIHVETLNWTAKGQKFDAYQNYDIVAVDHRLFDAQWMTFRGIWGPEFPLNLTDSQKTAIIRNIFEDGVEQMRWEIPAVAATMCAVLSAPCLIFYPACFAGCMAVTVTGAEIALDPVLDEIAPGIVDDAFPNPSSSGPSTPGNKRTVWGYFRYPDERPRLVSVADPGPGAKVSGNYGMKVAVADSVCEHCWHEGSCECSAIPVDSVELGIAGDYLDITAGYDGKDYLYSWDTTAYEDGSYELHAQVYSPNGRKYDYYWDNPEVMVANSSLLLDAYLNQTSVDEGGLVALAGSFHSPSTEPHTLKVQWGDGTTSEQDLLSGDRDFEVDHQYLDDDPSGTDRDSYSIQVTVSGPGGLSDAVDRSLTVKNLAPVVDSVSPVGLAPLGAAGAEVQVQAWFSDSGTADSHDALWEWDDGLTTPQAGVTSPVSSSHTYDQAGVYTIGVTVTDDDTGSADADLKYAVVHGPVDLAGAGVVMAPVAEYDPDQDQTEPQLTLAEFGFVLPGQGGDLQFRFNVEGMEFLAAGHDSAVLGTQQNTVEIQGTGTINGTVSETGDPYSFLLWALDDATDEFYLKIWWYGTDGTEYVYETPQNQALTSGGIVIP